MEAPEPLVEGFLDASSTVLLFGPPEAGKTTLMAGVACHVATGAPWAEVEGIGRAVTQGVAVYVATEQAWSASLKFQAWEELHRRDAKMLLLGSCEGLTLADAREWDTLAERLGQWADQAKQPVRLLVIDTVPRIFGELSENDASAWNLLLRRIARLREAAPGLCVVLCGHPGKSDTKSIRGSSLILGAADAAFSLAPTPDKLGCVLTREKGVGVSHLKFDLLTVNGNRVAVPSMLQSVEAAPTAAPARRSRAASSRRLGAFVCQSCKSLRLSRRSVCLRSSCAWIALPARGSSS